jgi:hypothetical protein
LCVPGAGEAGLSAPGLDANPTCCTTVGLAYGFCLLPVEHSAVLSGPRRDCRSPRRTAASTSHARVRFLLPFARLRRHQRHTSHEGNPVNQPHTVYLPSALSLGPMPRLGHKKYVDMHSKPVYSQSCPWKRSHLPLVYRGHLRTIRLTSTRSRLGCRQCKARHVKVKRTINSLKRFLTLDSATS